MVLTLLTEPIRHIISKEKYDCRAWGLDQIFSQDVVVVVVDVVVDNIDVIDVVVVDDSVVLWFKGKFGILLELSVDL